MRTLSKATEYNWRRLKTSEDNRLTSRANKTASKRRVTASGYLADEKSRRLLESVRYISADLSDIMYSLCIIALEQTGISGKPHVENFMRSLSGYKFVNISAEADTFRGGVDTLGFIYQSMLDEGHRNSRGIYYTSAEIAKCLTGKTALDATSKLLDPCCGSGAFLMSVDTDHPECLYGFDIDPIAVMIATVNLMMLYPNHEFRPNIRKHDFLSKSLFDTIEETTDKFDYIYTNPPWGTDRMGEYSSSYGEISSREKASMIILESLRRLKSGGKCGFVLPLSLINIKTHSDIRRFITMHSRIDSLLLLSGNFDGVFTDFFAIELSNEMPTRQKYCIKSIASNHSDYIVLTDHQQQTGEIPLKSHSSIEESIISKIEEKSDVDLSRSIWALGIVTGDNKNKLHDAASVADEPIYTGKQVKEIRLDTPKKFIRFNPNELQQCASEKIYRAAEKLIYRFIAKYPIVAYDDSGSLCLNSANILIPQIDGISVKSIASILNSAPYRYYYSTKYHDIKVLKGNLSKMPIPALTSEQDAALSDLTDRAMREGFTRPLETELNSLVSSILGLTTEEQSTTEQYGKIK